MQSFNDRILIGITISYENYKYEIYLRVLGKLAILIHIWLCDTVYVRKKI